MTSRGLLYGGAEVGEQIGPSLAEEHQPRLGDPVGAPSRYGRRFYPAHQSNGRCSAKVVDKFVFIHATILGVPNLFVKERLTFLS